MKTVLVTTSKSPHGNTRALADVLAAELSARILAPEELTADVLEGVERIGFGSGIYLMDFDRRLRDCIDALPDMKRREAFIFATSGLPEPPFRRYTDRLGARLEARECRVVGAFLCRGLDTWGPFGLIGGVSKGHPSAPDFEQARRFAAELQKQQ